MPTDLITSALKSIALPSAIVALVVFAVKMTNTCPGVVLPCRTCKHQTTSRAQEFGRAVREAVNKVCSRETAPSASATNRGQFASSIGVACVRMMASSLAAVA